MRCNNHNSEQYAEERGSFPRITTTNAGTSDQTLSCDWVDVCRRLAVSKYVHAVWWTIDSHIMWNSGMYVVRGDCAKYDVPNEYVPGLTVLFI